MLLRRRLHLRLCRFDASVVRKWDHLAPHFEHAGFVAYAGAEVAGLHWIIGGISLFLLLTGLWVMWARI